MNNKQHNYIMRNRHYILTFLCTYMLDNDVCQIILKYLLILLNNHSKDYPVEELHFYLYYS